MGGNGVEETLRSFGEILHLVFGNLWPSYLLRIVDIPSTALSGIEENS